MLIAANKNVSQTEAPVFTAAIPGKIKTPPNMPAMLIAIAEDRFIFLSSFFIKRLILCKLIFFFNINIILIFKKEYFIHLLKF